MIPVDGFLEFNCPLTYDLLLITGMSQPTIELSYPTKAWTPQSINLYTPIPSYPLIRN
jgi:hypothetical protein